MLPPSLPIDPLLGDLVEAIAAHRAVLISAEPGAGKTTRLPPALLNASWLAGRGVIVTEPRRLAAKLAASRVAQELGQPVGDAVGYWVRHEQVTSRATRLHYATDGLVARRWLSPSGLANVGVLILDEFHERRWASDLCLALAEREWRTGNADLKLVVMSATLEVERLREHLGGCPLIACPGKLFPVAIDFENKEDDRPLPKRVVSAVRSALREESWGDILAFLPGAREIRETISLLQSSDAVTDCSLLPLHGDLPLPQQQRALAPASHRKVVVSTNIAESSLTLPGVGFVVDSGLARVARHSPWSGLTRLGTEKVSQSSATQRAGRAGRVRAGRVTRLYTRSDFSRRPEHDAPEITRTELSEILLMLLGAGFSSFDELAWLSKPPAAPAEAAMALLERLGAVRSGRLTQLGKRMAALPVHPRLARMLVFGESSGAVSVATAAAALLDEGDVRSGSPFGRAREDVGRGDSDSDIVELLDRITETEDARLTASALRATGLDGGAVRRVIRNRERLRGLLHSRAPMSAAAPPPDEILGRALLSGFPDRVAKRRSASGRELVLCGGSRASLSESSVVRRATFLLALHADEGGAPGRRRAVVRLASALEPEWLLDGFEDQLVSESSLTFDRARGRVERWEKLRFGSVVLEESHRQAEPSPEASRILARACVEFGLLDEQQREPLDAFVARTELVRANLPGIELPELFRDAFEDTLSLACRDQVRVSDVASVPLTDHLKAALSPWQLDQLRRAAPERITLPGGRHLRVHYEVGKPPWISSRIQDFFGMPEAPTLCAGRVRLIVHLLAPNRRAVQVTSDLGGFWERHYPELRRQLMRRYPKHSWPENGRTATPSLPGRSRRT